MNTLDIFYIEYDDKSESISAGDEEGIKEFNSEDQKSQGEKINRMIQRSKNK